MRFASLALLLIVSPASAAVLVVMNGTDATLSFTLDRGNGTPDSVNLEKGESRPFAVGRHANVTYSSAGAPTTLKLDAYSAYVFTKKKNTISLNGIELAGKPV